MPIDFENSLRGSVDISGQPDPVRTPRTLRDDTRRRLNQSERRPQAQDIGGAIGGVVSALGSKVRGAEQGLEGMAKGVGGEEMDLAPKRGDFNPIDWARQDASTAWGFGRLGFRTLTGAWDDGVHNLYAGHDAKSQLLQSGAEAAIEGAIPLLGTKEKAQEAVSQLGVLTGRQTREQAKQEVGREREQMTQEAPRAAADIATMALPGTLVGRAAMVGIPLLEDLLSDNPDDRGGALLWAGIGGMLFGAGPLSRGASKVLREHFVEWPRMEKTLQSAIDHVRQAGRNFGDPAKRSQGIKDRISEQLARGAMGAEYSAPLARGAKAGVQRMVAEVGPGGEIKLLPSEAKANLRKLLNRVGVEDVDELVHKAQTEGISDPKAIKAIKKHWQDLGLGYNLRRYHPEEAPLRDPRRHIETIGNTVAANKHRAAIDHMLDTVHRGLFASHSNPMTAVLRALAGHNRLTQLTHQQYVSSILNLVGKEGMTQERMELVGRAVEGDAGVYDKLRPEEQMVADGFGLIRAAEREARASTGVQNVVPNWMPRTDRAVEDMIRGRGRPSRASVLAREATLHREESLQVGPGGQLVLGQRFKTVQEANQALAQARSHLIAQVTDPSKPLTAELANDPNAKLIHAMAAGDPVGARERAVVLAARKYADKETNFLLNVNRVLGNQVRATHTLQALGEFTQMFAKDSRAAALQPMNNRQRKQFIREGYKTIDDPRFAGYVFHPDLADNLNRYVNHASKGLRDAPFFGGLLKLEGALVAAIMFAFPIHGLNIAGRWGMAAMMNPIEMAHYLLEGKALLPHQWDDASWLKRSQAIDWGLVPHFRDTSHADNLLSRMQDATGDVENRLPDQMRSDTRANRMRQAIEPFARTRRMVNNYFWGWVNDFGVMMTHLEYAAAKKMGMEEEAAKEYAGRRGNSWMGSVAPEDTNPMIHDLSRLALFAPNWWRTWGELMVPFYRRAGFREDPAYMKLAAYQGGKTIMAALAWQKMMGNAFNFWASGHLQNENQPGNQDKIEISNSPFLSTLQSVGIIPSNPTLPSGKPNPQYIDPQTGVNPATGGRYTIENPLARQQQATELGLGLKSGQTNWQPGDLSDGLTQFLSARSSPLLNSLLGMGNVDLYQTIHDGQFRAVNPVERAGSLSPANLLYGAIMMVPGGQQFADQVNRSAAQGDTTPVESALGTRVPRSIQDAVGDIKDPVQRTLFSWLTGTNPAYVAAQRTRGQKPSDQDYQRVRDIQQKYQDEMQRLSAETLAGQKTPAQWHQAYRDLSRRHAAQMEALFKGSPEYVNGAEGLMSQYDELYQKALREDGTLDYDQLLGLQNEFRHQHTPDQLQQMDALRSQNDTKYPMLALYHKTLAAYDKWQEGWATQNGLDVSQIRKEAREYGQLAGDTKARNQYLREHRELGAFERAKQREWNRSQQGMMYRLFHGQNAAVMKALRARHLTEAQFAEQQESA